MQTELPTNIKDALLKLDGFAIATSGGVDSMYLCHLCNSLNLKFTSIIIDHKYRKNSSEEAISVQEELKKHNIDSIILTNNMEIPSNNIEKNLRDIRYDLITNFCKENNIDTVLTAHHLDDNIETFLMRLERGSSLEGLCGIKEYSSTNGINFFRPLLTLSKEFITSYMKNNQLKWFEDESNQDTKFTRNKIRASLSEVNDYPTLKKRLSGVITSLNRTSSYIKSEVQKHKKHVFSAENTINKNAFLALHEEIALRILKEKILEFYDDKNKFRFDKLNRVYQFILEKEGRTELAKINIIVTDQEIFFEKT